jgi:hypothetical protein
LRKLCLKVQPTSDASVRVILRLPFSLAAEFTQRNGMQYGITWGGIFVVVAYYSYIVDYSYVSYPVHIIRVALGDVVLVT